MSQKIFAFLFFVQIVATLYASPLDCNIKVHISQSLETEIKVHFTHDANCTLRFDEFNNTLIFESNQSKEDINETNQSITQDIVLLAKSYIGTKYKRAGKTPEGFDCSGFVYYIFKEHNISIPRTSFNQAKTTEELARDAIDIGDILSFDTSDKGKVNHTGIYIGEGEFIHSSSGKAYGVTVSKLDRGFYKDRFKWGIRVNP
jgi:cell wall-associated NlpC family hydrolase